jgi:uncharacterized protein (TIGR02466 family)
MTTASLQAFSYFPAMVYRDEHPEWVGYLKEAANKYYTGISKDGPLCQTYSMVSDPAFKFLLDYLVMSSVEILESQGYAVGNYDFYVSQLWGQDVDCMGGTDVHVHKNSQISGWLFLETPENGAYPVYHDPRMNKAMVELDYAQNSELTDASSRVHFNNVKPGTVLMANSWLQHQLIQNNSQAQTKSIHFVVSHRDR